MNGSLYPHRLNSRFGILMAGSSILLCFFGCKLLDSGDWGFAIGWLTFAGACLLLGRYLMQTAGYHADFSVEGVTVTENKPDSPVFLPWASLSYGCRARSRKGHPCLILSPQPLDQAQAKVLAQKSARTDRLLIEGSVVLFLQQQKKRFSVEDLIPNQITIQDLSGI